jgi:hypothetical protein
MQRAKWCLHYTAFIVFFMTSSASIFAITLAELGKFDVEKALIAVGATLCLLMLLVGSTNRARKLVLAPLAIAALGPLVRPELTSPTLPGAVSVVFLVLVAASWVYSMVYWYLNGTLWGNEHRQTLAGNEEKPAG